MANDPIEEIKEKLDIVEVIQERIPLTRAGKNFKALCPFHKEKTPSFIVSPERQTWHCFGACNTGGDVFSFVMKYDNLEFYEALKMLAEKAGVELKKISPASQKEFGVLFEINLAAKNFFVNQLSLSKEAGDYLSSRNLKKETIEEFEIGFAPLESEALTLHLINLGFEASDIEKAGLIFKGERGTYTDRFRGRIMFPLYNNFGKVVGFSGRILPQWDDGKAGKYINTSETNIFNKSRILYGFHKAKPFIKKENESFLVEGQMDFLALWQEGIKNAVAVSGTALTLEHLKTLKRISDKLIIGFDNDEAGKKATERAIDLANSLDFEVKVFLVSAKDVAEFISQNPGKIKNEINLKSFSALEFYLSTFIKDPSSPSKSELRLILEKVSKLLSPLEQNRWIKKIAEKTKISEPFLLEELALLKKKKTSPLPSTQSANEKEEKEPLSRLESLALEIITLILADKRNLSLAKEYRDYFPADYLAVLDWLEGKKVSLPEKFSHLIDILEMKVSFKYQDTSQEKLFSETNFLLKELKREFLKERRKTLLEAIQKKERENDLQALKQLLEEFDQITKLLDNS